MKLILWKIDFGESAVKYEKVECDMKPYKDGICQFYDPSTGITYHNYSTEILSRWYGKELREVCQKNLEWLNGTVIPGKLAELEKYINKAKILSDFLEDQPINVAKDSK